MSDNHFYHIAQDGGRTEIGSVGEAIAARAAGGYVWLDFVTPTREDLEALVEPFGLHPLAIEDCLDEDQVPKLEDFSHNTFILFNRFQFRDHELGIDEIDFFLGSWFLITVAARAREGRDVTVVTFGALVHRALVAARQVALDGIEAEVLDLRTLSPYDWEAIAASVRRTGRVVVAHEDSLSWGYGAEIAARVAGELFEHLDAPVRRVGALDTFVGYHPSLEDAILPQVATIAGALRETARY